MYRFWIATIAVAALAVGACGGDEAKTASPTEAISTAASPVASTATTSPSTPSATATPVNTRVANRFGVSLTVVTAIPQGAESQLVLPAAPDQVDYYERAGGMLDYVKLGIADGIIRSPVDGVVLSVEPGRYMVASISPVDVVIVALEVPRQDQVTLYVPAGSATYVKAGQATRRGDPIAASAGRFVGAGGWAEASVILLMPTKIQLPATWVGGVVGTAWSPTR